MTETIGVEEVEDETPYADTAFRPRYMTDPEVSKLPPELRRNRVNALMAYSHALLDQVIAEQSETHKIAGIVALYSGGNDSTTLAHMFKERASAAAHANTTIGIEQTRQFVRDTCAGWGLPLIEKTAPVTYRELVLDQGFPGPGHHWKMYQRLKERPLRQVRAEFVTNPRKERVIFLAGRRRDESARRRNVPEVERAGSTVWVSPLAWWTKMDLNTYREMHPDIPRNEVSDILHMSGECLCGAFAKPGELDEIAMWFPDVAEEIRAIEREVQACGKHAEKLSSWGHRNGKPTEKVGALCSSCLFDVDERGQIVQGRDADVG